MAHKTVSRTVSDAELAESVAELLAEGYRLALVAAHDDGDALRVVYLLVAGQPDRRVELTLRTGAANPSVPSLAELSIPAGRFEREMMDLYGISPVGHPQPRRLVRHAHWPQDWHPMRCDAGDPPPFDAVGRFPFVTVEGPGVYEIPVGPVHAGLIEPGHFRFSVIGESILRLKARLWFVHRASRSSSRGEMRWAPGRLWNSPNESAETVRRRIRWRTAWPSRTRWDWMCPNRCTGCAPCWWNWSGFTTT